MSDYHSRLSGMEDWYKVLLSLPNREDILDADYVPHADYLRSLRGRVVDVGGGVGPAARYMNPGVDYVVVDPVGTWLLPEWRELGDSFRRSGPAPTFVRAPGESLPFPESSFDSAIAFWSLNHAEDPALCIAEIARVLKPGGTARLVNDDIAPSWPDLLRDGLRRGPAKLFGTRCEIMIRRPFRDALRQKISGNWETQPDHNSIEERALRSWLSPLMLTQRAWVDGSLVYDLVKPRGDHSSR